MNDTTETMHEPMHKTISESVSVPTHRLLYWLIRRELWESRAIYLAPLATAIVILLGFLIGTPHLAELGTEVAAMPPEKQAGFLIRFYGAVAMPVIVVSLAVAAFYCLEALHGERSDRSILFWKSLPVSDLVTVLSKASIPLLVLPLLALAIIIVLQTVIRLLSSVILLAHGISAEMLWTQLPQFQLTLTLLYGLAVLSLWQAPVYAWLLLVSAWAKRSTFLWATLPPLALSMAEKIGLGTHHIGDMLSDRLFGGVGEAFNFNRSGIVTEPLMQLEPARFLASPGLWIGLVVAAGLFTGTVLLRRSRQPI